MESAAYGCATITSKKGGLPETFENSLFINKIKNLKYYYDQNELKNVLYSENEIFNTPFSRAFFTTLFSGPTISPTRRAADLHQ